MSNQFYMYWHPGDQRPEKMPEESEYYACSEWHTDVGNPNIGWLDLTRRWSVPEHVYRAHMFCETFGITVPEGYEVTGFRLPVFGETYLSSSGSAMPCTVDGLMQRRPILRGIKLGTGYRTPTDEDALRRPTVEVRDDDREEWRERTLLAVVPSESGSPFIATSEFGCATIWHQCRMKVTK